MGLTLTKSGTFPNPDADQGQHEFTYALSGNPQGQNGNRSLRSELPHGMGEGTGYL